MLLCRLIGKIPQALSDENDFDPSRKNGPRGHDEVADRRFGGSTWN